jgi:hypothetical protein
MMKLKVSFADCAEIKVSEERDEDDHGDGDKAPVPHLFWILRLQAKHADCIITYCTCTLNVAATSYVMPLYCNIFYCPDHEALYIATSATLLHRFRYSRFFFYSSSYITVLELARTCI